jgi:hypothetical protein
MGTPGPGSVFSTIRMPALSRTPMSEDVRCSAHAVPGNDTKQAAARPTTVLRESVGRPGRNDGSDPRTQCHPLLIQYELPVSEILFSDRAMAGQMTTAVTVLKRLPFGVGRAR